MLLLAAAVEAFLPRRRLLAMFQRDRGPAVGTMAGGALSLPSMLMIRRDFPGRVIVATGISVVVLGLVGAGLLVALS
ncbi:MAG: hypothetical protein ACRDQF_00540 [Thermocrispum sp.]